jgi:hypothetical protein
MKRALKLVGTDTELVLSIATKLHHPEPFFYLTELADGTWRLEYSTTFVESFATVSNIVITGLDHGTVKGRPLQPCELAIMFHNVITGENQLVGKFEIDLIAGINSKPGERRIYLEQGKSNKFKMTYSRDLIPTLYAFKGFQMVREED